MDHGAISFAAVPFGKRGWRGRSHPVLSTSGREFSSHPLLSASMGGRGICNGPTPPTPVPQEALRSDQADCYTDTHLRISTLIGAAGCWPHAGYHEAIGSKHTESHIPHGKEVPPGACWIIAPSQLLLHHWDAGDEGYIVARTRAVHFRWAVSFRPRPKYCMRHDWQLASTPQPDLVTSTVHNPRTPAATNNLDAHDPMAATPSALTRCPMAHRSQ